MGRKIQDNEARKKGAEGAAAPPAEPGKLAEAAVGALRRKAAGGDTEAISALRELARDAKITKLRKEMFGV